MMRKLIDSEWQHHGMRRRATIHKDIASIMNEDWRTREEVLEDAEAQREAYEAEQAQNGREANSTQDTENSDTVAA